MKNQNALNTLFYSKPVFQRGGPESPGGQETIPSNEIARLDNQLNNVVNRLNNVNRAQILALLKKQTENNLRKQVENTLKRQLDPYNPEKAEELFSVMYPPDKVDNMVSEANKKIDFSTIRISAQNITDVRFGAMGRFAEIIKNASGLEEEATDMQISLQAKPWENLGTQLANNSSVKPSVLRQVVSNARGYAEQALLNSIDSVFANAVNRQISQAVSNTISTLS